MRRYVMVLFAGLIATLACCAKTDSAFLEVRTTGDARISGQFFSNRNFTGWK